MSFLTVSSYFFVVEKRDVSVCMQRAKSLNKYLLSLFSSPFELLHLQARPQESISSHSRRRRPLTLGISWVAQSSKLSTFLSPVATPVTIRAVYVRCFKHVSAPKSKLRGENKLIFKKTLSCTGHMHEGQREERSTGCRWSSSWVLPGIQE